VYFDEIASYALASISSAMPPLYMYDTEGNDARDPNPALVSWCTKNHREIAECMTAAMAAAAGVMLLGETKDSRAVPILRQALPSQNHEIVEFAVGGLVSLRDTDSIPLIAENVQRFPPKLAASIAAHLADFDDPRVGPLLDRFVTDPKQRKDLEEKIRNRQK
jgi:HEAT repeat protein